MVKKNSNWAREVNSGLVLAFLLCAAVFILMLLSFFDLYALSHLRFNEAKMYADRMYRQEALRAQVLFDQGEIDARVTFLAAYRSAVVEFNNSCTGGTFAYWKAFGKYWHDYLAARKTYNERVAAINKECEMIRVKAHKETEKIVAQARSEIDPLFLIFKGKARGKIKGYFYDPANGDLQPQVGVVNKGKALNEKK